MAERRKEEEKMNKRAQVIGQIFIFIIAGIVFILILLYGYKSIMSFLERGEDVQMIDLKNEIESAITVIKRDYGSVQKVVLKVPTKSEEVCFVTTNSADARAGWEESLKVEQPMFYTAWAAGNENIFLVPRQPTKIFVTDIVIDPEGKGYACIPVAAGRVELRIEGTGNRALISEWPSEKAEA
jgi:hypothetical protein